MCCLNYVLSTILALINAFLDAIKFLLAIALFITTNAVDVCSFQETSDFKDTIEARNIKHVKKSTNPKHFTFIEKQMVHLTITIQAG